MGWGSSTLRGGVQRFGMGKQAFWQGIPGKLPGFPGNLRRPKMYRSIQIDYRQTFVLGEMNFKYRCRIVMPEELLSITETDLWECQQKISHCRYRFSLESQLIPLHIQTSGSKRLIL